MVKPMTTRSRASHASAPRSPIHATNTVVNRPQRKPGSDVDHRSETLAEFAAALAEHAGRPIPFMASVLELAETRVAVKMLKARRDLIFEQIKNRYTAGVTLTGDGRYELRMSTPSELITVRTVDSAAVKRAYPQAWQAARLAVPRVTVSASKSYALEIPVPKLPIVPGSSASLDRCVNAYKHRAFDRLAELRETENRMVRTLEMIADDFGWDGLPMAFHDGWSIGLIALRFNADVLRESAPAVFDELAVEKVRGGTTRLYLARPDDDAESIDLDAE
jgi:hypothetical protein